MLVLRGLVLMLAHGADHVESWYNSPGLFDRLPYARFNLRMPLDWPALPRTAC